jgi:hypothetical protein
MEYRLLNRAFERDLYGHLWADEHQFYVKLEREILELKLKLLSIRGK